VSIISGLLIAVLERLAAGPHPFEAVWILRKEKTCGFHFNYDWVVATQIFF